VLLGLQLDVRILEPLFCAFGDALAHVVHLAPEAFALLLAGPLHGLADNFRQFADDTALDACANLAQGGAGLGRSKHLCVGEIASAALRRRVDVASACAKYFRLVKVFAHQFLSITLQV
jgi:hypothetical protein